MYDFSNKPPNFLEIICPSSENLLFDSLEDDEKTRYDEKQGDGADEHSTDGAYTE